MMRLLFSLLVFAASATAVEIGRAGIGQYLIYPYFDVRGTQQVFLTIENTGMDVVALKLRVIDGKSGEAFWASNLYLSGNDVWTATLMANSEGRLIIRTRDASCLVPQGLAIENSIQFNTESDTAVGFIEVVEMGVLINETEDSAAAARIYGSVNTASPQDCMQLANAWSAQGYWTLDPLVDLAPPKGEITGELSTINVPEGTLYSYHATALANYSLRSNHTDPAEFQPDLRDTYSETDDGTVISMIDTGQGLIVDRWNNPIHAVNAALIGQKFQGRFVVAASIGAQTELHVTLPTWALRFDESGLVRPPFEASNGFSEGVRFTDVAYDENGIRTLPIPIECSPFPCRDQFLQVSGAISTFPIEPGFRHSSAVRIAADGRASGYVEISATGVRQPLTNETSGNVYRGAPAIMLIQRTYTNGKLTDEAGNAVRANYSDIMQLRRKVKVEENADP